MFGLFLPIFKEAPFFTQYQSLELMLVYSLSIMVFSCFVLYEILQNEAFLQKIQNTVLGER